MVVSSPSLRARALEVARVYAVYDQTLRERGLVDFGDLVARPVTLLRDNPEICNTVCAKKRWRWHERLCPIFFYSIWRCRA